MKNDVSVNQMSYNDMVRLFQAGLPGEQAHFLMVPPGRRLRFLEEEIKNAYSSAVLILLFAEGGVLKICLTRRAAQMKHHAGQISFPGGKIEPDDSTAFDAALRETAEEIGIDTAILRYVGNLSEIHVEVSNFIIYPVVAWSDRVPVFSINHNEVDELIVLPVEAFLNKEHSFKTWVNTFAGRHEVPCYLIGNSIIWGATAMMLAELAMLLNLHIRKDRTKH